MCNNNRRRIKGKREKTFIGAVCLYFTGIVSISLKQSLIIKVVIVCHRSTKKNKKIY